MNMEEFLKPTVEPVEDTVAEVEPPVPEELDVQKQVVEDLAAEKAQMDESLTLLQGRHDALAAELAIARAKLAESDALRTEIERLKSEVAQLKTELTQLKGREIDMQERNPNALALLDRDIELPDRFPGETRDHVLEVIAEARAADEKDGRLRRAQVLEAVLLANEPNGTLKSRRGEIEKLFRDNANLVNGPVIEVLQSRAIPFKDGETYLLPGEILKRNF